MPTLARIARVAVIGAGPGGLAVARALRNEGSFEKITVFERNAAVGGTWIYSPVPNPPPPIPSTNAIEVDPPNRPAEVAFRSAMYDNLHTNLPKDVMAFRDVPFPSEAPVFPSRVQVLEYIQDFAVRFNLLPLVRLNTNVVRAEPNVSGKWLVSATHENKTYTEEYDAVVVASGHYNIPYIPDIPGLREAALRKKITIMHSREYRRPTDFAEKTVLVIGGGSSASDIVREISDTAAKVYHCVRTDTAFSLSLRDHPKIERVGLVEAVNNKDDVIECKDGKQLRDVDTIIFGTGYLYSFPFLQFEQKELLLVDGQKVHRLYKHLFYKTNPTLAFIGLPIRVAPFPLMQAQSMVIARCWSGKVPMPSSEEMEKMDPDTGNNDRKEMVFDVETEFQYVDQLNAWAEGRLRQDIDAWHSTDPITGRLPDWWKERRKASKALRKEYLGY